MATEYEYARIEGKQPDPVYAVGVIAPPGYSPPPRQLSARLRNLLIHRRERVSFHCVFGTAVSKTCLEIAKEKDWLHSMCGPPQGRPIREWLNVLVGSHALVIVHGGGPLMPDLWELARVAEWMGVKVRVLVIGPEPSPL